MTPDYSNMDLWELLSEIIDNPTYLTDPYYKDAGNAITARAKYFLDIHHRMAKTNRYS